jgi:DNA polymerase I-like protein with 3'-5' exonuclease and polymerase domains
LLEWDISGAEVRVGACYHKDPVMIDYINDKTKDMHRDMAMELFMLPSEQVTKPIRHISKNGYVFPEFYGSYYEEVAPAIWKTIQRSKPTLKDSTELLIEHLVKNGIHNEAQFLQHVQNVESNFWGQRFRVYDDWKLRTIETYNRRGFLDTLTGFRIQGPLRRNQIVNYPIQGSAFHCMLWALTRLCEIARKEKWESKWVGQIHDSAICDVVPEELPHVVETIKKVMTKDLIDHWPWIIVPMEVEMEITPVDTPWYFKKPINEGK